MYLAMAAVIKGVGVYGEQSSLTCRSIGKPDYNIHMYVYFYFGGLKCGFGVVSIKKRQYGVFF